MGRVIHFEIHASDPERAIGFYTNMFGWGFHKWEGPMPYWLVKTGEDGEPGINGGLMPRHGAAPVAGQAVNAYVCTVDGDDLDAKVAAATANGAEIALAKMEIPNVGWLAYVKDTEGNIIGMMQRHPNLPKM